MPGALAQLRFRRMLAEYAGRRIRRRKIPRMRGPTQALLRYRTAIRERQKTLAEIVREILLPALPAIVAQGDAERGRIRQDAVIDDILRTFSNLQVQFATVYPETSLESDLVETAQATDVKNEVEFQRQMKAGLGVEMIVPGAGKQTLLQGFIQENIALVTSQEGAQLERLRAIVSRGVSGGVRVEGLRDQIMHQLGVNRSRADLLARDQTLKLFGELSEHRQTSIGIDGYTWSTSDDERVRSGHRALANTPQKWNKPPIVDARTGRRAHPGQDYQCRCQPIPDVDGLLDTLQSGSQDVSRPTQVQVQAETRPAFTKSPLQTDTQAMQRWVHDLPASQKRALMSWTETGYDSLRQIDLGRRPKSDRYRRFKQALRSAPKTKGTTYRGMGGLSQEQIESMVRPGTVIDMPVSSWTAEREQAKRFSRFGNTNQRTGKPKPHQERVVFRVNTTNGVDVSSFSEYPEEREIVLDKSKYRVVSSIHRKHRTTQEPLFWEVTLEEL